MARVGDRSRPYALVVEDVQLQQILGEEIELLRDRARSAKDVAGAIKQRFDPLLRASIQEGLTPEGRRGERAACCRGKPPAPRT
jgi:hypothetical protein